MPIVSAILVIILKLSRIKTGTKTTTDASVCFYALKSLPANNRVDFEVLVSISIFLLDQLKIFSGVYIEK